MLRRGSSRNKKGAGEHPAPKFFPEEWKKAD